MVIVCNSVESPGWLDMRQALWPEATRAEHIDEMMSYWRIPNVMANLSQWTMLASQRGLSRPHCVTIMSMVRRHHLLRLLKVSMSSRAIVHKDMHGNWWMRLPVGREPKAVLNWLQIRGWIIMSARMCIKRWDLLKQSEWFIFANVCDGPCASGQSL